MKELDNSKVIDKKELGILCTYEESNGSQGLGRAKILSYDWFIKTIPKQRAIL